MEPFECNLKIEGISDQQIEETFSKTLNMFEKWGYRLEDKVKFLNEGKIEIIGRGKDKRCAFCEYFRKAVEKHFIETKAKGHIDLMNCPFNPDKRVNYSTEAVQARKELLEKFAKMKQEEQKV